MSVDRQQDKMPEPVQTVASPAALQETQRFLEGTDAAPANPLMLLMRLMRGRWVRTCTLSIAIGLVCALLGGAIAVPTYQSEGLVRIIAREPKILFADRDDSRLRLFDAFVAGEATYMQSRTVLERAYAALKKAREEPDRTPAFKTFRESLNVKKMKGLIRITSTSRDPELSTDQVNAVLDGYATMHAEQSERRHNLRTSELSTRIQELLARRAILEQRLLDIGEEYDSASLAKAHIIKVTELEELDNRLAELANSISRMEASSEALDADTGDMEIKRATLLDRAMADMVFERAKRAAELAQMSLRYQREHPQVARRRAALDVIDQAIEHRRRLIATLGKTGAITGSDGAEASQSLAELVALRDKLAGRRKALSDQAKQLNSKLIQLKAVTAERSEISSMLAETRRVLDQVRLESRNSLPGTAEILSRGHVPLLPASDKRKAFVALGLVCGGGLVFVALLLSYYLHPRVRHSDDVAGLFASTVGQPDVVSPRNLDQLGAAFSGLIAGLHFDPCWQRDRATIMAVSRFDQDTQLELVGLARASADLGLRTLFIADDSSHGSVGGAPLGATNRVQQRAGFDLCLASLGGAKAVMAQQAGDALKAMSASYDLIIIDVGKTPENATSQTLSRLADMRFALVRPGHRLRQLRVFAASYADARVIFVRARRDDPAISETSPHNHLKPVGEQYA